MWASSYIRHPFTNKNTKRQEETKQATPRIDFCCVLRLALKMWLCNRSIFVWLQNNIHFYNRTLLNPCALPLEYLQDFSLFAFIELFILPACFGEDGIGRINVEIKCNYCICCWGRWEKGELCLMICYRTDWVILSAGSKWPNPSFSVARSFWKRHTTCSSKSQHNRILNNMFF